MESITNLIVRRPYGTGGKTIALNAHGDVVPPGEGWSKDPYGAEIEDGKMSGRATAVSKASFPPSPSPCVHWKPWPSPPKAVWSCTSPTTKSLAACWAPAGCWMQGLTQPDLMVAAGFSYEVVTAHNGCLQMEVTVHGKMAHAAVPRTGCGARCKRPWPS